MAEFRISITGTAPLLMHSARLSDPLDPATKAVAKVSGKRSKTDEDHVELSRLEHAGSLYLDENEGPFIPALNLEACLFKAAAKTKLGTALKTALLIPEEVNPLIYRGPRTVNGLWADKAFVYRSSVKVGTSRIIRTRPVFHAWSLSVAGSLDTAVVDADQFAQIVENAGLYIGLGDWRPRFGRFSATLEMSA